jgi:hypothetical protein
MMQRIPFAAAVVSVSPSSCHTETLTNEPIMNTSPWAKLISSMMP